MAAKNDGASLHEVLFSTSPCRSRNQIRKQAFSFAKPSPQDKLKSWRKLEEVSNSPEGMPDAPDCYSNSGAHLNLNFRSFVWPM